MTKFDAAFNYMIQYEGTKFSDDPTDRGGASKFGISEKFIEGLSPKDPLMYYPTPYFVNGEDKTGSSVITHKILVLRNITIKDYIKSLTLEQAKWIYIRYFWLPVYEQIEDQDIANYVFDIAVNHGPHKAAEIVQRALNVYFAKRDWENKFCKRWDRLKTDGIWGDKTLNTLIGYFQEVKALDDYSHEGFYGYLLEIMIAIRESFYRCIVAHNPNQQVFLEGWLKRAYGEKL